jgi:hypothetical protein
MILLQRTQELKKTDWETLRLDANLRFGSESYAQKLDEVGELMATFLRPLTSTVGPQNLLLAVLKEEERGGSMELEAWIPDIIHSLRSGDPDLMRAMLMKLVPPSEEARKLQQIGYKEYQRLKKDPSMIDQILLEPVEMRSYPVCGGAVWTKTDTPYC